MSILCCTRSSRTTSHLQYQAECLRLLLLTYLKQRFVSFLTQKFPASNTALDAARPLLDYQSTKAMQLESRTNGGVLFRLYVFICFSKVANSADIDFPLVHG